MKTITVKTICTNSGALPTTTLADPDSPLGNFRGASLQVRRITDIPDEVSTAEVIRVFERTVDLTWLGGQADRNMFGWAELGEGKVIRSDG